MTTIDLLRHPAPEVSILVVTYGGWDVARRALEALREHTPRPYEVIVVDNASPDGTRERLRAEVRGATVLLNDRNAGFGPAVNQAAAMARGRYLVLLNSDAIVRPGWLEPLVEAIEADRSVGAAVSRLLNDDGSVQEAGSILWADGSTLAVGAGALPDDPAYRFPRTVDYGSAACLLIRRSTFEAVGGFHPAYLPAYCEDVDLSLGLRRLGLRTVYEPSSEVVHVRFGSTDESSAARLIEANREILRDRWGDVLAGQVPPEDPDHRHRVVAARDGDVPDRILVLAPRPPVAFLERLAAGLPDARITLLLHTEEADPEATRELCALGIEVAGPLVDPEPWFGERLFHLTAAVVLGERIPIPVAGQLEATQPQAAVIPVPDDDPGRVDAVLGALTEVGVAAGAPSGLPR